MESEDRADRDYLWRLRQDLLVQALTNRRYQLERQRVMEFREGAVKVCSLAAGSVAVARVANAEVIYAAVALIFVGTSSSLVFGWGNKARDAGKRAAEWLALEGAIAAAGERDFTESQISGWKAEAASIETGEPAPNTALLEWCYREACMTLCRTPEGEGTVARWRMWLPHVLRPIP